MLDSASKTKLVGIHPALIRIVERAARGPIRFKVIEGMRTIERQRQLKAKGASQTLNSRHLTGHAVDIVPLDGDGDISWAWPLYYPLAEVVKAAAKAEGVPIEWGGDWKSFKDGPHWQLPWKSYPAAGTATFKVSELAAPEPLVKTPPPPPPSLGFWAAIRTAFGRFFRKEA